MKLVYVWLVLAGILVLDDYTTYGYRFLAGAMITLGLLALTMEDQ